ncbi:DUF3320 domain-containing protein [Nocardia sp. NPDC005745]|uniref:DUF3320 domain-containing protein n=1 Tax=Nocardia sp. NPDC005745 TaxID=3157061 RepID=UPI0033EA7F7F
MTTSQPQGGGRELELFEQVLAGWRKSLVDLSGRNRLLNFRHTKTATLEISAPSVEALLRGLERGMGFAPLPDLEPETGADNSDPSRPRGATSSSVHEIVTQKTTGPALERALRNLRSKSTQIFNDYGLWTLQLGVGMLHWREEGAETGSDAPLVLVPVRIERTSTGPLRVRINEEDEPRHNPALRVKLEQLQLDWTSVSDQDPMDFRTVQSAAAAAIVNKRGWKLSERVVLALFASHKESMYQDLLENQRHILRSDLVRAVALGPRATLASDRFDFEEIDVERIDEIIPPETSPMILDADASQRQAVAAAVAGHSFVLDGPPGTGKSQTITNIIGGLLHAGRSVLFVSEKAAALDVVLNRLRSVGLDSYALALHSHNTSRKAIAQELGRALTQKPVALPLSSKELLYARATRLALSGYAEAMNELRAPLGETLHDVIGRIGKLAGAPVADHLLPSDDSSRDRNAFRVQQLSGQDLSAIRDAARVVAEVWAAVTDLDYPWRSLHADTATSLRTLRQADAALERLEAAVTRYRDLADEDVINTDADLNRLAELIELLDSRHPVPEWWLTSAEFADAVEAAVDTFVADLRLVRRAQAAAEEAAGKHWYEMSTRLTAEISDAEQSLAELSPPGLDPGNWTESAARRISRDFKAAANQLESTYRAAIEIADELGLDRPRTLAAARDVCRVIALADVSHRPLEQWLTQSGAVEADGAAVRVVADLLREFFARRDRVREAQRCAISNAGPAWDRLPADLSADPPDGEVSLGELAPVGLAITPLTKHQIGELDHWFTSLSDILESADRRAATIAVQLGCPEPATMEQAEGLVALLELSTAIDRPLDAWFDPQVLPLVRQVCDEIVTAAAQLDSARQQAQEWFRPEIVEKQGIAEAIARLTEGPRGLGGLMSRTIRADRKLIASMTVAGAWHSQLYELLPLASAWCTAYQHLRGLARGYVDLLGRYAGTDLPEVERLQAACSCAEEVHRLATTTLEDPQRRRLLLAHLADGRESDPELTERGVELGRDLARWRVDANRLPLSAYATELSKRRPGEIARWLSAHLDPLQRAAALVDVVTATCGEGGETAANYSLAAARAAVTHAHSAQQKTADFLRRERKDRQLLGSWYKGLDTNPSALAAPISGGSTKLDPVDDLLRRSIEEMSTGQGRTATTEDYELLGRYCTDRQVDSDLLGCALEAVKIVDRVASASLVDPTRRARLCKAISDSRPSRPGLVRRAERIADGLDSWEVWTKQPEIADRAAALQAASFEASIHWLCAHIDPADDAADLIRSVSRVDDNGGEMSLLRARAAVAAVTKAHTAADEFEAGDERWPVLLGEMYCGVETDHSAVLDAVNWAQRVRRAAGGVQLRHSEHGSRSRRTINASRALPLSSAAARTMLTAPVDSSFDQIRAEWRGLRKELAGLFETERSGEIGTALSRSLSSARAVVSRLSADQRGPEVWSRYRAALAEFIEHGLGALPSQLARQGIAAADVAATVERAILTAWVEDLLATDVRLASIRAEDRNRLVEQFRAADRELIRGAPAAVINSCDARRPRRTNVGSAAVITSEAEKQRRHMPVRRLLRETRDVVQRIKPCFMMSPLTVSQFLPPDFRFDVVIFDEASQVRPEDAINSIYRADALIVAGDQKQLPPTSFFGASGDTEDDEWDEDDSDAFQSVLDACKASGVLRSLPLRWHYRSRHENLIAFSNHEFYRNTMVTFPGASQDGPDIGVEFFKSSGVYDRSGRRDNSGEAALVAERVIHHYATRPSLTLGVVALSKSQADAIEAAVEKARAARPDLGEFFTDDRLDGFFVKNLENVQGDERDVIILSIGYGRDQQGKLRSEFGPINRGEGWRRLNVAVTRARRRVELVASFRGGELPDSTNKSVQHLKRYLLYAESGPRILATAAADADAGPESPFEEQVIDVLRDWGYDVQPQVGVAGYRIDMAIKHPEAQGIYALGIECDGAMYHSSRAARDRDRLRESVLRDLGWRLHRIWGTDWYRNRADAMERLRSEVAAACAMDPYSMGRPEPKKVRPEPSRTRSDEVEEPSMSTAVRVAPVEHEPTAWTRPYQHVGIDELIELRRKSADRRGLDLVALQDPEAFEVVADIVLRVVEVEGPVEEDLLFTRVRTAWGVGRSGSVIQVRIREVLHWLDREKAVVRLGTAYDLPARELRFVRTATSIGGRLVRQIPAIERQLAIRNVIADCLSVRREELLSEVAGVFGWTRVRSDIRATLTADLDSLIGQGIVEETALGMTLAGGV